MTPFPLRNEADYTRALALVETLWTAAPGTPEAAVLDELAARIEAYEAEELATVLPPADPRKLIAFKLRELGLSQRALARQLGWGAGRVSEVISGRRALTLAMVRDLAPALGLKVDQLVPDCTTDDDAPVMVAVPRALARQAESAGFCGHRSLDELVEERLRIALNARAGASTTAALRPPPTFSLVTGSQTPFERVAA